MYQDSQSDIMEKEALKHTVLKVMFPSNPFPPISGDLWKGRWEECRSQRGQKISGGDDL